MEANALAKNDDAIAIAVEEDTYVVCNVDILVWNTDVPTDMTPYEVGGKVVTMTMSDVVAKGAKPIFFLSANLYPSDTRFQEVMKVTKGIKATCEEYDVKFLGGDLGEGEKSITGVGVGFAKHPVPRSGAQPGDGIWVTGEFGKTRASFHYLLEGGERIHQIEELLRSVINPTINPSYHKVMERLATAAMDSSDGLSITLHEIAKESDVHMNIDTLPLAHLARRYGRANGLSAEELTFFGGEEFEIVFTSSLSDQDVRSSFKRESLPPPIRIGDVKQGSGVTYQGKALPRKGWEHFKE